MSNPDLQKLVHEHSVGFIPRDVYLIRRREIIDNVTALPEIFSESSHQETPADLEPESTITTPAQSFNRPQLAFAGLLGIVVLSIAAYLGMEIFGSSEDAALNSALNAVENHDQSQSDSMVALLNQLTASETWTPGQLQSLNQQWNLLPEKQQSDIKLSREWQLFVDQVLDRMPGIKKSLAAGNKESGNKLEQLNNLAMASATDFELLISDSSAQLASAGKQAGSISVVSSQNAGGAFSKNHSVTKSGTADTGIAKTEQSGQDGKQSLAANVAGEQVQDISEEVIGEQVASAGKPDNSAQLTENADSPSTDWTAQSDKIVKSFKSAMEKGEVNNIVSMFADDGTYLSVESKPAIKRTLDKLLSNTTNRKVDLVVNSWNRKDKFIVGVGKYKLQSDHLGLKEQRITNSDLKIVLASSNNNLKIAAFDIFNKEVIANPLSLNEADAVSLIELKKVMSLFVKAYEKGDLNELVKLFSEDAQTNDQKSKEGVINDYSILFNTTSARQMYIKNMKWNIDQGAGSGQSDFVVLVTPKDSGIEQTFKGKLKVTIEKKQQGPMITRFFHEVK